MEIAAGVVAAEQVISTTIEGGIVAGYAIGRQTNALKAHLTQFSTVPKDTQSSDSLARFSHSLNAIDGDLFIFSGLVAHDKLAGNEMHIFKLSNAGGSGAQYKAAPALAANGVDIPCPRFGHAACVIDGQIVMFGGCADLGTKHPVDEKGIVWVFDPKSLEWTRLDIANERYPERYNHSAAVHGRRMIIHGGYANDSETIETDTWLFDLDSRTWTELPAMEDASAKTNVSPNIAVANNMLYVVLGSTSLDSEIRVYDLASAGQNGSWTKIVFPTNPLTPGPRPRKGASLLPITTGMGRTYLLLVLGEKDETQQTSSSDEKSGQKEYWSGLWTLQLPSASNTPAKLKDAVREKMGMDTEEAQWSEVQLMVQGEEGGIDKSHPGPRGYFACAAFEGNKVALWGGLNAAGDVEGDGWIIDLKTV